MKTIIIVEDEYRIRQGLAKLIEKVNENCKVVGTAENGAEGLQMILQQEPDIVITDIQMPKMDGLQMMERVRDMGVQCEFVILSGYSDFEYARKGIQLGVKDYLLKPVNISMVKELLEKLDGEKKDAKKDAKEEPGEIQNYSAMVQGMIDSVEQNCALSHTLESFAEKYHITPEYLSNLFTKETGKSFSNYKRQVRMEKAKTMLLNTDMKVYEVACAVGYPDQKYFSKIFREYTGVSAKQYAANQLQNK